MKKTFTTFSGQVIFLIILVAIVLILAALLPPKMQNVEGFSGVRSSKMLSYSAVDGSAIDTFNNNSLSNGGQNPNQSCVRTIGGLHCNGGDDATVGQIDRFYSLPSDTSCAGSSLTKGNGNICLDDSTKQLLTSRGGNVTWGDSQIG
jgi:hypothetical protein